MSIPELGELEEEDWNTMLDRIADGKCTPFLSAGVNAGLLPLGSAVSRTWAKEFSYPLENCDALDQVAEFIAIRDNGTDGAINRHTFNDDQGEGNG